MPAECPSTDAPVKIGPPVGIRKSRRLNSSVTSPTKVQPGWITKSCHRIIQCKYMYMHLPHVLCLTELLPAVPSNQLMLDDAEVKVYTSCFHFLLADPCFQASESESESVAQCPAIMPWPWRSSQGLTEEEHKEEYFNSFHTKFVTLKNGQKLDWYVALNKLHAGIISMWDMVGMDGDEQCKDKFSSPISLLKVVISCPFEPTLRCPMCTASCPFQHLHWWWCKWWTPHHAHGQWRWQKIGWRYH